MDYRSPFGANFNVEDSLLRLENSDAESRRRSSPKNSSLDAERWKKDHSPSRSWRKDHSPSRSWRDHSPSSSWRRDHSPFHNWRRDHSPFHNWRNRASHGERNRSFDSDYVHQRNHSMRHRQVEGSAPCVQKYYNPSMLDDPWRELEQNLTEAAGVCNSREHSRLSNEREGEEELGSVM